jgi:hypothetical protein
MKATTKYITKLIVAKPFVYATQIGNKTIRAGRVLKTIKNAYYHYYPRDYTFLLEHGCSRTIPAENLRVKWFDEIKTTATKNGKKTIIITTKEVKVIPRKA